MRKKLSDVFLFVFLSTFAWLFVFSFKFDSQKKAVDSLSKEIAVTFQRDENLYVDRANSVFSDSDSSQKVLEKRSDSLKRRIDQLRCKRDSAVKVLNKTIHKITFGLK